MWLLKWNYSLYAKSLYMIEQYNARKDTKYYKETEWVWRYATCLTFVWVLLITKLILLERKKNLLN